MNEFKIKKYQYLFFSVFIILFGECLAVRATTDNDITNKNVSISWFVNENGQKDDLTEKLTRSFEKELHSAGCVSLLERRNYDQLHSHEKKEKAIADIKGEGHSAINREKQGQQAEIIVFGRLEYDNTVAKVTVEFKEFSRTKILDTESVYLDKNTLEDIKSRDNKMAELAGKICQNNKNADANANSVCETFEEYSGRAEFEKELTKKAEKEAIRRLVSVELDKLMLFSSLEREDIVESLRPLLQYDGIDKKKNVQKTTTKAKGILVGCFKLKNPKFNRQDLFEHVFIGKVCHFNSNFLKKHVKQLQENFIWTLKDRYRGQKKKSSSIISTPNFKGLNFEGLKNRSYDRLSPYVYEDKHDSHSFAIEELQCIALYVYPVELLTESTLSAK